MKHESENWNFRKALVIVAHPDDETLWVAGTILSHRETEWTILSLCRGADPDRAMRFTRALEWLNAAGEMADLNDGPEQAPLSESELYRTIFLHIPTSKPDLLITHSPEGEYTRHRRHQEIGQAVLKLWIDRKLDARELWLFAYEDNHGSRLPRPMFSADRYTKLTDRIWKNKYNIITEIYGFDADSFEAKTTPREESFWTFQTRQQAKAWLRKKKSR